MIKVKCFGIARDIVDADHIKIPDGGKIHSVRDLKGWISAKFPELNKIKGYMIAVNQEYAEDSQSIEIQDELAIIPPVSGG